MRLLALLIRQTYWIPTQMSVPAYQYRMTKTGSTNISHQQKNDRPTKFQRSESDDWLAAACQIRRLACCSMFCFFSPSQQVEFQHCRWRDRRVEDASITVTQEPSDWVERAPLQWFHGLPSWGGKFLLYLPLLLPQSACFLRLVTLRPKNGPDYPVIILRSMYQHEVWPKVREWTTIKKARLA